MNISVLPVFILLVLAVLGAFIKTLAEGAGLSNFTPIIRDTLIVAIAIYGAGKFNNIMQRKLSLLLVMVMSFSVPYLVVSMIEGKEAEGLYYLRLYLMPFAFFIGAVGALYSQKAATVPQVQVRFLLYFNAILFIVAVVIYILLNIDPYLRGMLWGPDILPTAWYISGGTWMRMGLPASSPNTLGLVFSLNAIVFIIILITRKNISYPLVVSNRSLLFGIAIALIGLMLTFSRSSMLLLSIGTLVLFMMSGGMTSSKFLRTAIYGLVVMAAVALSGAFVDARSDGYLSVWLGLNLSLSDPSMMGHVSSIEDAIDKAQEYILWGYPKGTVGPKALQFGGTLYNVENSILAVIFDMGLFIGVLYWLAIGTLYKIGYQSRYQVVVLVGFSPPLLLLPYVFETDALIYFSFIYILLGMLYKRTGKMNACSPDSLARLKG